MIAFLRRLIQRYGFFKREPDPVSSDEWYADPFYRSKWEHPANQAVERNIRLAEIARERAWLYENKAALIAKKKGFYVRLRALKNAEMAVEQGKPEPGK